MDNVNEMNNAFAMPPTKHPQAEFLRVSSQYVLDDERNREKSKKLEENLKKLGYNLEELEKDNPYNSWMNEMNDLVD